MPQNLFKIYDGRNYFWQWDTNQKLIVLDDTIDEVHFLNKGMTHSISKDVFIDKDGKRVCYVPDALLTLPKNIIAEAVVIDNNVIKSLKQVKFAVQKRPIPSDYVVSDDVQFKDLDERLGLIEEIIADACLVQRFDTLEEAETWAQESKDAGAVISVNVDSEWITYVVKEDYSIVPICDCDQDALISAIKALQNLVGESVVADQIKNAINVLDLQNTYDAKGSASNALVEAKKYTDNKMQIHDEAIQNKLNEEIDRAKNEEAAITRELYQISDRVTGAQNDVDALERLVGILPNGVEASTIVDYIDKKTEGVALDESILRLNNRITGVEESIDTKIAEAVAKIMDNPDEMLNSINELVNWVKNNFAKSKIATVTLFANSWVGDTSPYSQVVTVNGVTENSKIDLQPTALQIVALQDAEIVLTVENNAGIVAVWAIGDKPTEDMKIQVEITEVTQT